MSNTDTIAAIATAAGRGGVGVIRISGPKCEHIAEHLLQAPPPKNVNILSTASAPLKPRYAHYRDFVSAEGEVLDQGLALYFPGPNSFTGEDVLELQGHGGPVILNRLLKACFALGARQARPGEFSERAFLNDKLDLSQAEAIADLIDSNSEQAARNAMRSLQGQFSNKINALVERITQLRIYVEAAIDFPEEEIDFLADQHISEELSAILRDTSDTLASATQGAIIREGMNVVIAGKPNAGKSSLLNALAGKDSAIVTDIAGTTRDVLREHILIDNLPLHIIDTAGIRDSDDPVEQEGIRRAAAEIQKADRILLVLDSQQAEDSQAQLQALKQRFDVSPQQGVTIIHNKCDLLEQTPELTVHDSLHADVRLSAKQGLGLDLLKQHLKQCAGLNDQQEDLFTARSRHTQALRQALEHLQLGQSQLQSYMAGELLAEELRLAQNQLGEITGKLSSDELLGKIFSSFCIGK